MNRRRVYTDKKYFANKDIEREIWIDGIRIYPGFTKTKEYKEIKDVREVNGPGYLPRAIIPGQVKSIGSKQVFGSTVRPLERPYNDFVYGKAISKISKLTEEQIIKPAPTMNKPIIVNNNIPTVAVGAVPKIVPKTAAPKVVPKLGSLAFTTPVPIPVTNSTNRVIPFPQNKYGWDILFKDALKPRTYEEKEKFRQYLIEEVANKLPCKTCMKHTQDYFNEHDIRSYYNLTEYIGNENRDIGLFKYLYEFKNDVNKRLRKPQLSFAEVYKLYN